ncbi:ABC transporter ATP-binding protein [Catellatospora tritici]|uniref:ABC transporter ATP-binding protein n=1 Tax=Catellatospora tritici TaxID=2851566 RepID=UPI001C2D6614|nr:ATP-binding cassette domain-containing protein [Catellatospora tritici]MBV1850524.1 ATP-binding cassette domain-containing protein [Catellatospora tritici]
MEFRKYVRRPGLRGALSSLFSREYETVRAVDGVSFEVPAGAKTAYIGANGAGKSTTIKLLTGIMTPTGGRCLVNGVEPYRDRRTAAQAMGVVFGQRTQLWWDLSVTDSFRILQRIYDIPDAVYQRNLGIYRELLDIDELGGTPVRMLSLGQRMRAEVAASLLHDPKVVFWDEPTIGLDLMVKDAVRALINRANTELGTTVVLTSHDLGDITSICDQVLVVDKGRVIHQGTIAGLVATASQRSVLFSHSGPETLDETVREVDAMLPKATASVTDDHRVRIDYPADQLTSREVLASLLERFELTDCYAPEPELKTVIQEIYTGGRA